MHTGMLWFDNSKTIFSVKIQKAVDYYHKKYGKMPTLCLVHPSMLSENTALGNIMIRPYRPVLPGHIWIGIEDEPEPKGEMNETSQMGVAMENKDEMDMERIENETSTIQEEQEVFQDRQS